MRGIASPAGTPARLAELVRVHRRRCTIVAWLPGQRSSGQRAYGYARDNEPKTEQLDGRQRLPEKDS
jgi:hypothetical protein